MKINAARALGKCQLTDAQKDRIRLRVLNLLEMDFLPGEFRTYAWLVRRIGIGRFGDRLAKVDTSKPWPAWYVDYMTNLNPGQKPSRVYWLDLEKYLHSSGPLEHLFPPPK